MLPEDKLSVFQQVWKTPRHYFAAFRSYLALGSHHPPSPSNSYSCGLVFFFFFAAFSVTSLTSFSSFPALSSSLSNLVFNLLILLFMSMIHFSFLKVLFGSS